MQSLIEQEKYNNTQHGVSQSLPSFNIEEAMIEINRLKSSFKLGKDSTMTIIKDCDENQRQFKKSDALNLTQEILDSQLSSSDVSSILNESGLSQVLSIYEKEINEENVNARLKVHGQRHVIIVFCFDWTRTYSR